MKTILAAIGQTKKHDVVLSRAIQLATLHSARIVLLHVIESDPSAEFIGVSARKKSDLRESLQSQASAKLKELLVDSGRVRRSDVRIEFGAPHELITRVASDISADLIVIGAHQRQSLSAKILGSTADRVLRTSPVPILVVKRQSIKPYKKVVVAIDFSPSSKAAAVAACKLAPGVRLQLVHVIDIPPTFEEAMRQTGMLDADIEKYLSARIARARDHFSTFVRKVRGIGKPVTVELEGDPRRALVRLAQSDRVDLLALGSHGRGVVLQALLGSVAQRVLREAACDTLVTRSLQ